MEVTGVFSPTTEEWRLATSLDRGKKRIIYFDNLGQRVEKEVPKAVINDAMAKFRWPRIAVERSTGGFSAAEAVSLLLYDVAPQNPLVEPEFRIRVRLTDIHVTSQGEIKYETCIKDVKPIEIVPRAEYRLGFPQRFVLDLGQGPVPIHIFDFGTGWDGNPVALFIELDDLKEIVTGKRSDRIFLWTYQIRLDAIRCLVGEATDYKTQYQQAYANYYIQKTGGKFQLPRELRLGSRLQIPCGIEYHEIASYLQQNLKYDKAA